LQAITKHLLAHGKEQPDKLAKLSKDFYAAVPGQRDRSAIIDGVILSKKQKLCRLLKDMVSVSESTGWAPSSASEAKYRSLNCTVNRLDEKSQEYQDLLAYLDEKNERKSALTVERVYTLSRGMEDDNFKIHLKNRRNLFHSSDFKNFVGLLSRYGGYLF
jgi:poly [ADP-ribose] polymerase